MIKVRGYQKKVIFLKNTGSHLFDEAYFVVSREGEAAHVEQSDMIYEANRIIKESLEGKESRVKGNIVEQLISAIIPFLLGVLVTLSVSFICNFIRF